MLDDLRQQASEVPFDEGEDVFSTEVPERPHQPSFLGMTPAQRFVIALMLLMMVCIIGSFFLLVTGRVAPYAYF
jgi:hypothetical protein